jgi:FkbM family methyltransferase
MFNPGGLRLLYKSAKALGLGPEDTSRWLWSYYASRLPNARSSRTRCVKIQVAKHELTIRTNGFDWMVVEEIFLRHVYQVPLSNVRRVLDLGDHIGVATVFFADAYPDAQICTVEPESGNLAVLDQNVKLNQLPVTVVAAAVGTADGKTRIQLSDDPRQHTGASSKSKNAIDATGVEVEVRSVASLMDAMGWQEVDLIKMDIEGMEKEVLAEQPEWLKRVRGLICEGHLGVGYTIDCARRDLEPMGFRVEILDQNPGAVLFFAHRAVGDALTVQ